MLIEYRPRVSKAMSSPEEEFNNDVPSAKDFEITLDRPLVTSYCERPKDVMRQVRASIISNFFQKSAIGAGVGIALSLGIFRRRISPIFFTTGFGMGMAVKEGDQMVRQMNDRLRQNAIDAEKNRARPKDIPDI